MADVFTLEGRRLSRFKRKMHTDGSRPVTDLATARLQRIVAQMPIIRPSEDLTPFLFDRGAWLERTRNIIKNATENYWTNTNDLVGLIDLLESELIKAKAGRIGELE